MTDILFQDKNVYIQRECDFKKSGYYQKYIKYKKKYIDLKKDMLGGGFSIFLRFDKIYEVTVNPEDTIENVIILFIKASGIDGEFKIIYKGKELESQRTVTDYNIVKDETLIINNKIRRQRTVQNIYLLEYLFNKLKTEYAEGQQIMISTMSANQNITNNTQTKVQFDTERFDTNSNYDSATNYRFTPTVAGKYQINAGLGTNANVTNPTHVQILIYKNGSIYNRYNSIGNASNYQTPIISSIIDLNGSTDYVEIYVVYEGANGGFIDTSTGRCWFDGSLIS